MPRRRSQGRVVLAVALAVALFGGCGDAVDEAASGGNGTVSTTTGETTTTDATPSEGVTTTEATTTSTEAEVAVGFEVFFLGGGDDCDEVVGVPRTSSTEGVVGNAIAQLLAGPTDEERAQGLTSWFSEETDGMLQSVRIEDGVARVSFDPALPAAIPNASTSCGSVGLLAQLDETVTQFDEVERAVYALGGEVTAFYEWLQLAPPES